ncbi:hypothetical protein L917_06352 [Phytophthora nicotianae]|uniref:Uncharacterized protein n=3 Tax=Phytophthora nicotianae TaxID=4792 RepID=V9FDK1_PHYNI|nr:hypothetical protein F443_06670 [Phytophthora nicotianae P1569]ETK89417.1 hypothetical protein L915_06544 [Phytophthora nicotianae]ETL95995.1 hypothetical protein L917_06352 [Phytophthora nicotianae]ETM49183.1 hypothetical protein L914_06458 [Phytophthora nicotianae]ETO78248.1 hypothetical protein F444_06741 [Phytophthora nicotianae P1976]
MMDDLEQGVEQGVEPRTTLSVQLAGNEGLYNQKYRLVAGQWELHKVCGKCRVRGKRSVILDNDTSFRMRAIARNKISEDVLADIQRHLDISIPDGGTFFRTEVMLSQTAPAGVRIRSFEAKSIVHVKASGLCFTICYLDQHQDEFRLKYRLATVEKEKLNTEKNEAQVLLGKVLEMLA